MPIVFTSETEAPIIIEKSGTEFIFRPSIAVMRRARTNLFVKGESDYGAIFEEIFRLSLVGWNNLISESGEQVPFSAAVRDKIVTTDIFDTGDIMKISEYFDNSKKKPVSQKKSSKNA